MSLSNFDIPSAGCFGPDDVNFITGWTCTYAPSLEIDSASTPSPVTDSTSTPSPVKDSTSTQSSVIDSTIPSPETDSVSRLLKPVLILEVEEMIKVGDDKIVVVEYQRMVLQTPATLGETHECPFCVQKFRYTVSVSKVREHYEEHLFGYQCTECLYRDSRVRNFKRHLKSLRKHRRCPTQVNKLSKPLKPLSPDFQRMYKLLQRITERKNHERLGVFENRSRKLEELRKVALLLWEMPECSSVRNLSEN